MTADQGGRKLAPEGRARPGARKQAGIWNTSQAGIDSPAPTDILTVCAVISPTVPLNSIWDLLKWKSHKWLNFVVI